MSSMCENTEPMEWEAVLVDWVNCLKLYKPIHNICELRDGVFLRHLRKLIRKSTDPIPDDDLTIIFNLLACHYPKIKFAEKESIHIADLPHQDLVNLASLLMHYTCIYDRKNVLTAPLCYNLSPPVQLHIRSFLEKLNGDTTTDELASILNNMFPSKRTRCQLIQAVNTPLAKKSPLQDLLKTPVAKHLQYQEKEREIERLKRELEITKYEKSDLEAELKEQHAKVLIQLQQKCSEVKRLRAEVESLEMRTPPHFQDIDSRESQKLLRLEIQNLEQYVQRCEEEHEELRKDRDEAREKVRILEVERNMWQEKFFDIEEKFLFFTEHTKDTETQNETLKAHCIELQNMLEEYRNKSSNLDESMPIGHHTNRWSKDFNPLESEEDLAHSVVDIQLKEVEKKLENALEELEKVLEEKRLLEDVRNLNDNLKRELTKETSNRLQLEREHEGLLVKLKTVMQLKEANTERGNLQIAFEALESSSNQKIACLMETCEKLELSLKNTETKQQEILESLESVKVENEGLAFKLVCLGKELADTKNLLSNTESLLDSAEQEKQIISQQLDEARQKLAESEESLKLTAENLEAVTSESFTNLRQTNAEKADLQKAFDDMKCHSNQKIAFLREASEKLELCLKNTEIKQQETLDALEKVELEKEGFAIKLEYLVKGLDDTKSHLIDTRNELDNAKLEKHIISKQLEETQRRLTESEENLKLSAKNLKDISSESLVKLTQANAEKADLQKAFESLESSSQQKIASLTKASEKLESSLKNTETKRLETLEALESVKLEKEDLTVNLDYLAKDLEDTKNLLSNTKEMLETAEIERQTISKRLEKTEQKLAESEENIKLSAKNFEKISSESLVKLTQVNAEKADLQEAFEALESSSQQKIASLTNASEKLESSLKNTEIKWLETLKALESVKLEKEDLTVKLDNLAKDLEDTKNLLSNTKKMLETAEIEGQTISKRLEKTEQKLAESEENIKLSAKNFEKISSESFFKLTQANAEKADLQKAFEALENSSQQKIASLTKASEKLESKLKDTETKRLETLEALESVKLEKEDFIVKLDYLAKDLDDTKNLLSNTKEMLETAEIERQTISKRLEETEQKLAESEENIKLSAKNLEEISSESIVKLTQANAEKADLQKAFEALESSSQQKIASLTKASEKLESNLKNTETKRLETLEALESVKLEKEDLIVKLDYLAKDLDDTKNLLCNTKNMLETAEIERQTISKRLEESEQKLAESEENIKLSTKNLEEISSESFVKLTQANAEKADLQKAFEALESSSNLQIASLTEALKEMELDFKVIETKQQDTLKAWESVKLEKENLVAEVEYLTKGINHTQLELHNMKRFLSNTEEMLRVAELEKQNIKCNFENVSKQLMLSEESLKISNQRLEAVAAESDAKLKQEYAEKAILQEALETLKSSSIQQIASLRDDCEKLQSDCNNLDIVSGEKTALEERLLTTSRMLEDNSKHLEEAREELEKVCNDKMLMQDKLTYTVQHLEVTMEKLEQTEQLLQSSIIDKESAVSHSLQTAGLVDEVQRKLTGIKEQLEEVECERTQLAKQVEELTANLQKIEQEKSSLSQTLNIHEDRHAELIGELMNVREEKTVMSKFLDLNSNELRKLTQEKEQILEALEMSNEDNQELNLKLASLQNVYEKLVADKVEILENLQKTIKDKEELFSELNSVSAQLETIKKENGAQVEELQQENRKLNELLEAIQKDKEDIVNEKAEIHDFLQRSVADNEQIMRERDRLQCENAILAKERDTMYEMLQTAASEKQNILLSLELSQKETEKVKKERNEILQSQTEIMKETGTSILRAHEVAVEEKRELLEKVETVEKDRNKLREAYAAVIATSSSQERDIVNLRKKLEQRNNQMQQLSNIKEAYEKLLEQNNRHMEEIDVLKQKKARDREECLKYIKKEREEGEARKLKKVKEVQAEYEQKLEKMRDRMLKLYSEEVSKEVHKVKLEYEEMVNMRKTIDDLKDELQTVQTERDMLKAKDNCLSRESLFERNLTKHGISSLRGRGNKVADKVSSSSGANTLPARPSCTRQRPMERVKSISNLYERESVGSAMQTKKLTPRLQSGDVFEETITVSRTMSINRIGQNLEMEDEDEDIFSDKCLADLKEGRCLPFGGRESNASRMSELVWRNSMVPPHLKSSYPAELQFVTPSRFGEDDIKTGNIELDDNSMCRLLPNEKPRQKKDFGTTTYKKPGPPTPSKNGGRASFQRNEIQPLREVNSAVSSTPKKITPSRIKSLFRGFREGATVHDNTENISPQGNKRRSIFKARK